MKPEISSGSSIIWLIVVQHGVICVVEVWEEQTPAQRSEFFVFKSVYIHAAETSDAIDSVK